MSYYCRQTLTWDPPGPAEKDVAAFLAPLMERSVDEVTSAMNGESTTWYDSQEHLSAMSALWPATLFTMETHNEDGQSYVTYTREGRSLQKDILPPPFDEAEFQRKAMPLPAGQPNGPDSLLEPFLSFTLAFTFQGMLENRQPNPRTASAEDMEDHAAVIAYLDSLDEADAEALADEACSIAENGPAETYDVTDRTFDEVYRHILSLAKAA